MSFPITPSWLHIAAAVFAIGPGTAAIMDDAAVHPQAERGRVRLLLIMRDQRLPVRAGVTRAFLPGEL